MQLRQRRKRKSWQHKLMAEYRVLFLPGSHTVTVPEGTRLLDAAFQAGAAVESPCGGRGICQKCRMEVLEGEKRGFCLACQTKVTSPMKVRILRQEQEGKILTEGSSKDVQPGNEIRVCWLKVRLILPGESDAVWERVREALAKTLAENEENFTVAVPVLGKLYETISQGEQEIYAVLYEQELVDVTLKEPEPMVFAVDIGTTTLAGYLIDAVTGEVMARISEKNPQSRYGADVISRADYVITHGGDEMASCIRQSVSRMAGKAAAEAGVSVGAIYLTVLVGNTCMHHLFLGISPESLVHAPYSPVIRQGLELAAENYLDDVACAGRIKFLPNIAGFVGADTSACLLACDFAKEEQMTLLMDIGTNGELVLGNRYRSTACSTAAGPAFEGARISCGMRGTIGAIDHVDMIDLELTYSVIGDTRPEGICGSGLLDVVAIMYRYGFIDSMGMIKDPENLTAAEAVKNRSRIQGEGMARQFILYEDPEKTVAITQKDISEVQLAKAAMAAGIRILCEKLDIQVEEINRVLIAGAFGNYMNPASACEIGLLPMALKDKIEAVGNAAGAGAMLAAVSKEKWNSVQSMADTIEFAELAAEPDFSDIFVEELEFPTDS